MIRPWLYWFYWIIQKINLSSLWTMFHSELLLRQCFCLCWKLISLSECLLFFTRRLLDLSVITNLITEKITIWAYCSLKTWKCWLITAGEILLRSGALLVPASARLVTVSLVWEDPGHSALAGPGLTRQNWRQSRYAHLPPKLPRHLLTFCTYQQNNSF